MKAYLIGTTAGDDVCHDIVFANTVREAKVLANANDVTDEFESWIYIYAKRAPEFDNMENATKDEINLKKFREDWFWGTKPTNLMKIIQLTKSFINGWRAIKHI